MTSLEQNRLKVTTLILSPIQECRCGTRIDVSRYEALQELTCPNCSGPFIVQGQLDRYVLTGIAGHGGTGTVYRAHDPQLGRQVALKVVREDRSQDEEVLAQLEGEATITASLNHPHVLRVYSVGRAQGRFFIAMELVQGGTLDDLLNRHPSLPEVQALEIAIQMASGLEAAQQAGLVHRDVKPGNVLFSNASTAKVMDFGLAVFEQQQAAASGGAVWGTPFYMPPERLQGQPEDFRSDIYSLGTVLFQMLTGRPPFDAGTPAEVALKRLHHPAPSVLTFAPKVSNATAFVVKKMLERNPEDRFGSYAELIESMQFARAELGQKGKATQARVVLNQAEERKTGMWITLAFIGFMVVAGALAVYFFKRAKALDEVTPIPVTASAPAKVGTTAEQGRAAVNAAISKLTAESGVLPGVYQLKNRKNNQVVDVFAWNTGNDAEVKMWPGDGAGFNQRWIARPTPSGWMLIAHHSSKALEVTGASKDDNAAIKQGPITSSMQQLWRLETASAGYHRIVAVCSGKALTILDPNARSGSPIAQRAINNSEEQQWKLEPMGAAPAELEPIFNGTHSTLPPRPVRATQGQEPRGGRFFAIPLAGVVNGDSRTGLFTSATATKDSVRPKITGWVDVNGTPFDVLNPTKTGNGRDILVLRGGQGQAREKHPKKVEIPVNGLRLTRLHFLGSVAGWGYPWDHRDQHLGTLAAQVTVVRRGGATEALQFRNGIEIADYHTRNEVPGSAYVEGFADYERQARYVSKPLTGTDPVEKIIIEAFDTHVAPVFVAITGEAVQ